mmetsp:Transcript_10087/g.21803  ORF Transcript_10087/g.21803 Transcript_10087/m.21803 type:complete len:108 (-) Transcript_10087:100-423(-)
MRCVSLVSDASRKISESAANNDDLGPEELYDAFRGQYRDGAPMRRDDATIFPGGSSMSASCHDDDDWNGKDDAERIIQSAVSSGSGNVKVTADGETYFSVATARGDE